MTDSRVAAYRVGWIGTGKLGSALAARLGRAGVDIAAWNRTRSRAEPLRRHGVVVAETLRDVAERDVVFTTVPESPDLEQVLTGGSGLLRQPELPRFVVDCSTVSAETSAAMRVACADRGVTFLACPVSGNARVVAAGKLSMVVSGDPAAYQQVAPILRLLGRSVTYAGRDEAALLVKLCHNLVLGVLTQSLAEVTILAERGGVSRAALLDFLNNSVLGSDFTRYKTPTLVNLDFAPTLTATLLRKDFDLGLAAGRALEVPLPLAALTAQLIQAAIGAGRDADDFAVLLALQARSAGLELRPENVPVDDGLGAADDVAAAWDGPGSERGGPA